MNNIYIRGVALPGRVRGVTVKDDEDDYNVYINTQLCPETQRRAAAHEIKHIYQNHFYNYAPVIINELEANV